MIDGAENGNLLEQALADFGAELLLVNLLDGHFEARLPVPGAPHDGERPRTDSRAENVIPDESGLVGPTEIHRGVIG